MAKRTTFMINRTGEIHEIFPGFPNNAKILAAIPALAVIEKD